MTHHVYVAVIDGWFIRKVPVNEGNEHALWLSYQEGTNIFWSLEEAVQFMKDSARKSAERYERIMLYWQERFEETHVITVREEK